MTRSTSQDPSTRRRWTFYYDGGCGFCRSGVRALARLDLSHRVNWVPYQSLERPPHGLSWADLDRSAYLETDGDRWYEGFYALRMLSRRLWLLLPLYPLLMLPGMHWPGVAIYRLVARNRHRISPRRGTGCPEDTHQPPQ